MWGKEESQNISGKKINRCSIRMKVGFYEAYIYYIIYCLIFYIMTNLTPFFSD